MRIEDKRNKGEVAFKDLKIGDIFDDGTNFSIFTKIDTVRDENADWNAFCFNDHCLHFFGDNDLVIPVKAKLVIEE